MKKVLSLVLTVLTVSFTSCEELQQQLDSGAITIPEGATDYFTSGITLDASEHNIPVSFKASQAWAVETSAESADGVAWLYADPSRGESGDNTIQLRVMANESESSRTAKVTVTCFSATGDVSKTINVTQAGKTPSVATVTIRLDKPQVQMAIGETLQLIATVTSTEPAAPTVSWSSSNPRVASVTTGEGVAVDGTAMPGGFVVALSEGETVITARAGDAEATCKVTVTGGSVEVTVTEIKLDKAEVHMSPRQTIQLTATVKPDEAAGKVSVSWSSSRAGVASVDQEGKVTAVSLGETVITASAGNKSASCLVKVEEEVAIEGITLNETSLTLKEGETFQLVATLHPETATPKDIEWIASVPAVATVDEKGLVTAVRKGGPVAIWAVVGRGTGYEIAAKCEVTVSSDAPSIESITVNPGKITINETEETILTATVTPAGTAAVINWNSDNTAFVTVEKISDTQARIKGVGIGTTKVIASVGDKFDYCEVTVKKKSESIESISIRPTPVTLAVDEEALLSAIITPSDAAVNVEWSIDKPAIAALGSIGQTQAKIQGLSAGTATVTASAGGKSATCEVTVTGGTSTVIPVESITLNKTELELTVGQKEQLTFTVQPSNATCIDNDFEWTSTEVRKVYVNGGLVSALAICEEATITVTYRSNRNVKASCKVTVKAAGSGSGAGDEVVDLGLPSGLKWRGWNVGASKPEDYGNYYAWGETTPKATYTWSNYKYGSSDTYGTGVGMSGNTVLVPEDDAATANLGNGWRTPKNKEWKELKDNCTWRWTTRNGVNGMLVTSNIEGYKDKSIFLPAAGWYSGSTLNSRGSYGSYWSSSYSSNENALAWDMINSDVSSAWLDRSHGLSVRPVKD